MLTYAQTAVELLMEAAVFFRNLGENNEAIKAKMYENASIFEQVADLVSKAPMGLLNGTPHVELAKHLLLDSSIFFKDLAEENKHISEQMMINSNAYRELSEIVCNNPLDLMPENEAQEECYKKSKVFVKTRQFGLAIEEYIKILEQIPNSKNVINLLARAHTTIGEFKEAITQYKKLIEMNSSDFINHFHVTYLYYLDGDRDMAIQTLNDYSKNHNIVPYPFFVSAFKALCEENYMLSENRFSCAIEKYKSNELLVAICYFCRSEAHNRQNKVGESIEDLKKARMHDETLVTAVNRKIIAKVANKA